VTGPCDDEGRPARRRSSRIFVGRLLAAGVAEVKTPLSRT
jgi:hypothetical protein